PFVPAKTTSGSVAIVSPAGRLAAELGDEGRHVLGLDLQAMAVVDGDDGRPAAAADALDCPERKAPDARRLAGPDAELALQAFDDLLCACQPAGDVRADLDERLPDRREPEH